MPRKPLLLVLAVILLAAFCLLLMRSSGQDSPEAGADGAAAVGTAGADAPGEQVRDNPMVPAERMPTPVGVAQATETVPLVGEESAEESYLRGKVVDDRSEPIAGAWIASSVEGGPYFSDADGRFAIPADPDLLGGYRSLTAWAPGRGPRQERAQVERFAVIRLLPAQLLEYQVIRTANHVPIRGATARLVVRRRNTDTGTFLAEAGVIDLPIEIAPSDGDGILRVPGTPFQNSPPILVEADGFTPAIGPNSEVGNGSFAGRVMLNAERGPRVRFLRMDGEPITHATVRFEPSAPAVESDEDGWAEVPAMLAFGVSRFTLEKEGLQWRQELIDWQVMDGRMVLAEGQELLVDHFPREGTLRTLGDDRPNDYEIATAVTRDARPRFGFHPDPIMRGDRLRWYAVEPDGAFRVTEGWQGPITGLIVRRIHDGRVVLKQPVQGRGPYALELHAEWPVRFQFLADPMSALDDAVFSIVADGQEVAAPDLAGGLAELQLPDGSYYPSILLPGSPVFLSLRELYVRGKPVERVIDLGRLRTVTGLVTANGRPVFPCEVTLRGIERMHLTTYTGENGDWRVDGLPGGEMSLYLRPEDPWLVPDNRTSWTLPPFAERMDIAMPVAVLQLQTADSATFDPARVSASRSPLPEKENSGFNVRRQPFLPDLKTGIATVAVTPSVVTFRERDFYTYLEPSRVELREGDVKNVVLRQVRVGVLTIHVPAAGGNDVSGGSVDLQPASGQPALSHKDLARREAWRAGEGRPLYSWKLEPGEWRLTLRGPIYVEEEERVELVSTEESWTGTVRVEAGRQILVRLLREADGHLAATIETRE